MTTETIAQTKVCKKCGVKKPLTEFRLLSGRWRINHCDDCRRKLLMDYHHRTWPARYARDREIRKKRTREFYHGTLKPRNLKLYGQVRSPRDKEKSRQARRIRKEQTGYTKPELQRIKSREHFLLLRTKVIALYGGKCECCGDSRYRMITIDHKTKEPKEIRKHGVALVYDALHEYERSGYPNSRYRLLCWNCNAALGFYGYCPHTGQTRGERDRGADARWALKLEMIDNYGGRCALCKETAPEFLTIDHINGGGTAHRRRIGKGGVAFYKYLKRLGWPTADYRVLCFNCNCSVKTNRRAEEVEA